MIVFKVMKKPDAIVLRDELFSYKNVLFTFAGFVIAIFEKNRKHPRIDKPVIVSNDERI